MNKRFQTSSQTRVKDERREQKTAAASGRRKLKLLSASERGWRLQGCTKDGQWRQNRRGRLSRPRVSSLQSLQSPASKAGILFFCSSLLFFLAVRVCICIQADNAGDLRRSLVKLRPAFFCSPLACFFFCLSACCMRMTQGPKLRSCRQMVLVRVEMVCIACRARYGVPRYICTYLSYAH